ncbi:MAG: SDR family oxidoreductase [Thermoguttaceae bacterium]
MIGHTISSPATNLSGTKDKSQNTESMDSRVSPQNSDDSRSYHLLTGATGLLGSYLLRDLLRRRFRLAVLVRPSRRESSEERIESILSSFENETGESLPRPVVISGELTDDTWCDAWTSWVSKHCRSVIHCAASLTFHGHRDAEPWTTNIGGTERILRLCKNAGIRHLHHFSTAYVAGSHRGAFDETMLDVGQELRNDYEQSKVESEKMVREADFLDSLTVYRPSIVVGDSQTHTTSTYHGFYAVLKLAHTLVQRLPLGATSGRRLLTALGMTGDEFKNFVPVDWVSAMVTHIFSHRELHGKTYHLTNPNPTSIFDMVDTIQDAVETFSTLASDGDRELASEDWFKQNYADQVAIYRDYLNNDPVFVSRNTERAALHLPCPVVDRDMMIALAKYAIVHGFGRRVPSPARKPRPQQVAQPVTGVVSPSPTDFRTELVHMR